MISRHLIIHGIPTKKQTAMWHELERVLGAQGTSLRSAARRLVRDGLDSKARRAAIVVLSWKGERWAGIAKALEVSKGVSLYEVQERGRP